MSTALLVVDYQNDFVSGSLAVPNASDTLKPIARLAKGDEVDVIVMSRDWHPANHVSFSDEPKFEDFSWPSHCVQNTDGAAFEATLAPVLLATGKPVIIATKGDDQDKEAYSAFEGWVGIEEESVDPWGEFDTTRVEKRSLAPILDVQHGISRILVVGLALDYCVRMTALDGVANGFDTWVSIEATRPVAYETGAAAVAEMTKAGVNVVRTEA